MDGATATVTGVGVSGADLILPVGRACTNLDRRRPNFRNPPRAPLLRQSSVSQRSCEVQGRRNQCAADGDQQQRDACRTTRQCGH